MSSTTPKLGLFKYNPTTDGKEVFSIQTALNNNWDIIDNMDLLPDQTGKDGYILTTNGSEASWGQTAEIHCVIETYIDGASWYRIWSDGWCEQGGLNTVNNTTVTLLKPYKDTSYSILFALDYGDGTIDWNEACSTLTNNNRTTTSFRTGTRVGNWRTEGYIEV